MKSKLIFINDSPTVYKIFEDGTIINIKTNHEMKHRVKPSTSRVFVRLTINKKRKEYSLARLLALSFIKHDSDKTEVHHIDRDRLNNNLSNLQWVTREEHMKIHSSDKGHVFAKNEKHSNSILTNKKVHEICKLIENNELSQREIAKKFDVPEYLIHEIRLKHNWRDISKDYNFDQYSKGSIQLSSEKVREICKFISDGKYSLPEISKKCSVSYGSVLDIYHRRTFKGISYKYDFSNFKKIMRYSKELKHQVQYLMKNGKSNAEIKSILSLPTNQKTNTFLYRERQKQGIGSTTRES